MAPDGQAWAISTKRGVSMPSGSIQGPLTLAKNTLGAPVTQNRAWMQRLPSYTNVRRLLSM